MAITFSSVRDYRRGRANAEPLFIDMVALLAVALAAPGVFVSLQTGG
jgi:hypothetical protein